MTDLFNGMRCKCGQSQAKRIPFVFWKLTHQFAFGQLLQKSMGGGLCVAQVAGEIADAAGTQLTQGLQKFKGALETCDTAFRFFLQFDSTYWT